MAEIYSTKETTLMKIEEPVENVNSHRPYLGMSQLGHACERYLWYSFRWCYYDTPSPRMRRLFERGHEEEERFIKYLAEKGVYVYGDQTEAVALHGHCRGHNDGFAIGVIEAPKTVHVAEFKTMNDKSFKQTKKEGVKISKPVYYAQAQCYMKAFNKERTLFIAVNKNDDDWYIERLRYNKEEAESLFERADGIILSEQPPDKKWKSTWYECKWCSAKDICHFGRDVERNCRTCVHLDMLPDGKWECSKHDMMLCTNQQRLGCKKYMTLESLLGN